jgi:hypothetical protein
MSLVFPSLRATSSTAASTFFWAAFESACPRVRLSSRGECPARTQTPLPQEERCGTPVRFGPGGWNLRILRQPGPVRTGRRVTLP